MIKVQKKITKTRFYCDECEQQIADMPNAVFTCPSCGLIVCCDCTNNGNEGPCVECEENL